MVLRGINAFQRLESLINSQSPAALLSQSSSTQKLMSPTPEAAYRQAALFFHDRELFPDPKSRSLLPYLPPVRTLKSVEGNVEEQ